MNILVINAGSSSVKYQLFRIARHKETVLAKGIVEIKTRRIKSYDEAIRKIIARLRRNGAGAVDAVGHRVVHGGEEFRKSTLLTGGIIRSIARYNELAPLHNMPNLSCIKVCRRLFRKMPQVAVFDTAFHQTIPAHAYIYGLPYEFYKRYKVRRYGFHGTSHSYVASEAARLLNKPLARLRLITCHLGNGCSITAVKNGRSLDTSMGFTPLEGLIMGTRTGDVDPAVVFFLARKAGLKPKEIDRIFNNKSGLLGISGVSNDMRDLIPLCRKGLARPRLAVEAFVYRVAKYIGAYTAALGGADALVFTAGIGENQPYIRNRIKRAARAIIKKFDTKTLVIETNEELMIARETYRAVIR